MIQIFGQARLGRTAELRYTPEGTAIANLSLAFNYGLKGDDGKRQSTWVDASLWGKKAEALAPYLVKGQALTVALDDVHIESFKRPDGTSGSKLVARVGSIELVGRPPEQQNDPAAPAPRPAARPAASKPAVQSPPTGFSDMDDEIPF